MSEKLKNGASPATLVAFSPRDPLPAELADRAQADAGKGVSQRAEDRITPIFRILQTNSPQCDRRGEAYLDGAEPGHFLLRGAVDPIRDGTAGVTAVFCGMRRTYTEWLPDRGGYVGVHETLPADAEPIGGRRSSYCRADGNVLEDTRQAFLLVDGEGYMYPATGTAHTFIRRWETDLAQRLHPKTGLTLPSFASKYRLTTVPQSNSKGRWFGLAFTHLGYVSVGEYEAGKAFNALIEAGKARAEAPIADDGPSF